MKIIEALLKLTIFLLDSINELRFFELLLEINLLLVSGFKPFLKLIS